MKYLDFKSYYDCFPKTRIDNYQAICGYENIVNTIKVQRAQETFRIGVDTYPGVNDEEVIQALKQLRPNHFINMLDVFKDEATINQQINYQMTQDRVFGNMYYGTILDFVDEQKLEQAKQQLKDAQGLTIVYGFGAFLLEEYDLRIYLDLARWEIQLRMRNGMSNFKANNADTDILRKYKRGYFLEWRIADRHKIKYLQKVDYFIDTNTPNQPKMITQAAFMSAIKKVTTQPFRVVPYFDPGVWGGQWMKEVCNLDPSKVNYAWSFDGVPEENSVLFDFNGVVLEFPAIDIVLLEPVALLGKHVYARFGAEFPIRFDFLDTFEGQNLSLQVHPTFEYAKEHFGIAYTQEESYYILDAKPEAIVYLGLKEGVDAQSMMDDLRKANQGDIYFDAEKYINTYRVKKHDHYLIPAGTVHCSAKDTLVLEISSSKYIFTFKLWDWGRLGMDGLPRPVHLDHGKEVIQWDRTSAWVEENLVNAFELADEKCGCLVEHTGLHELEFIETRRYTMDSISYHDTLGTVHMLNLVDGMEAIVESAKNLFEPFIVHYAETFIIPANVGKYTIRPYGRSENKTIKILKAYVRS